MTRNELENELLKLGLDFRKTRKNPDGMLLRRGLILFISNNHIENLGLLVILSRWGLDFVISAKDDETATEFAERIKRSVETLETELVPTADRVLAEVGAD